MVKRQTSTCAWEAILVLHRRHGDRNSHSDGYSNGSSESNSYSYGYGDTNCNRDCHGDGNCGSERNSYSYRYANSDGYGDSNSYGNSHTGPDHVDCAGLPSKRATESGLILERRDFESGRRLPQRRVDRYH